MGEGPKVNDVRGILAKGSGRGISLEIDGAIVSSLGFLLVAERRRVKLMGRLLPSVNFRSWSYFLGKGEGQDL